MKNFILMDGYGIFVWSAFIFTSVCCLFVYLKTRKELKKQEKMFSEKVNELPATKIAIVQERKVEKQILVKSSEF